jgi:hypothetical protein
MAINYTKWPKTKPTFSKYTQIGIFGHKKPSGNPDVRLGVFHGSNLLYFSNDSQIASFLTLYVDGEFFGEFFGEFVRGR